MPIFLDRRKFLQLSALSAASLYLGLPRLPKAFAAGSTGATLDDSPVAAFSGPFSSVDFNGDDVRRPHDLLWDVAGYVRAKGGRPTDFREEKVVVIGGGMAGLLSAYFLRDELPLVVEQAARFGGNSQGESYEGNAYSIGAAYITVPDEGDEISVFLKETGLDKECRLEEADKARVVFDGVKDLWGGETGALDSARRVGDELRRIFEESYPEIPWAEGDPMPFEELRALDRETAKAWLHRIDPHLHPHVEEYFQLYCWSSFAGSLEEISAAQFLNFVASETVGVLAFPGGNSRITARLHGYLREKLGAQKVVSNSMVLEVKEAEGGVEVLYEDGSGKLQLVKARSAVVAAPKYVARFIVKGIGAERDELWKQLPYRAYVAVNVLLDRKVPSEGFDLFWLQGKVPTLPSFGVPQNRPWADFIYADWANEDRGNRSILTLYKPYPYEGARSIITSPVAHNRIRDEVLREMPAFLRSIGIGEAAVAGVRVTRWGHSLPLSRVGYISDGTLDRIGAPLGNIHFANQDNYMNPAFETSFAAAARAAAAVRAT